MSPSLSAMMCCDPRSWTELSCGEEDGGRVELAFASCWSDDQRDGEEKLEAKGADGRLVVPAAVWRVPRTMGRVWGLVSGQRSLATFFFPEYHDFASTS
jgi:hypothetical protein